MTTVSRETDCPMLPFSLRRAVFAALAFSVAGTILFVRSWNESGSAAAAVTGERAAEGQTEDLALPAGLDRPSGEVKAFWVTRLVIGVTIIASREQAAVMHVLLE